jgi:hypothetical protein
MCDPVLPEHREVIWVQEILVADLDTIEIHEPAALWNSGRKAKRQLSERGAFCSRIPRALRAVQKERWPADVRILKVLSE